MLRPIDRDYNKHGGKCIEHLEVFPKPVSYCIKMGGVLVFEIEKTSDDSKSKKQLY